MEVLLWNTEKDRREKNRRTSCVGREKTNGEERFLLYCRRSTLDGSYLYGEKKIKTRQNQKDLFST